MTTALIDSDIVAYQVAARFEQKHDFGDGDVCRSVDREAALAFLPEELERLTSAAGCSTAIVCLSDRSKAYFRKRLFPAYKANRAGAEPPALLAEIKQLLADGPKVYERAGLEADDVMGILATHPRLVKGKKVIVSDDKDMDTIPGATIYRPRTGLFHVTTPESAARYHMMQTLTGDATDGYPGCPGIGPKKAERALEGVAIDGLWAAVVGTYEARGLTEEDALVQARMARILRAQDYDFTTRQPRLWTPERML